MVSSVLPSLTLCRNLSSSLWFSVLARLRSTGSSWGRWWRLVMVLMVLMVVADMVSSH